MKRRRRVEADAGIDEVVQRAISALRGGAPASRVRRMITEAPCEAPEWRILAAAWRIAERSGAPLAPTLERFTVAMRALQRVADRRAVLLTGPRSTVRLVIALPPAAMILAALLGFDPFRALVEPFGLVAAGGGAACLLAGVRWAGGLARRAEEAEWIAGWEFELMAIGIGGGAPPRRVMREVVDGVTEASAEWVHLDAFIRGGPVERAIERAESFGTPLGPVLRAAAERARDEARADLERAAERLGVRILLPLGVCILPAFLLLGVVPVLIAVVGGTFG